jgi:hypothetical protein
MLRLIYLIKPKFPLIVSMFSKVINYVKNIKPINSYTLSVTPMEYLMFYNKESTIESYHKRKMNVNYKNISDLQKESIEFTELNLFEGNNKTLYNFSISNNLDDNTKNIIIKVITDVKSFNPYIEAKVNLYKNSTVDYWHELITRYNKLSIKMESLAPNSFE